MQSLINKAYQLKYLFIAVTAILLSSCGFHLRGLNQDIPEPLKILYIQNDTNNYQFINSLKPLLSAANINVVENKDNATAILIISNVSTSNNMQTVTGNLSAGQYVVTYKVTYKVTDQKGHTLLPVHTSTAKATYSSNATQQLAANYQVEQLTAQLSDQVANELMAQLSQVHSINTNDENIIIPDDSNQS